MEWKYFEPKFEYEDKFQDLSWPWAGHKFFAYDLVANMKPKRVVELGTHYGTSFWVFSQAVKDRNIETELNAVDSWEGEKHAGFYGEEVFETVNEIRNEFYPDLKINLIRTTFEEAVSKFEDSSIDILHIDGLHTYEAVKSDFETWLPKLKDNGIILFHDIVVTRDDFGVYKLWKELKEKYQTMEFHYSYGLGVLFKEKNNPLFNLKDDLELYYSYLLEDRENEKIGTILQDFNRQKKELEEGKQEIQKRELLIEQKSSEVLNLHRIIKNKDREILFVMSSKFWRARNLYINIKEIIKKFPYFIKRYVKISFIVLRRDGLFILLKRVSDKLLVDPVMVSQTKVNYAEKYDADRKTIEKELLENWEKYRKEARSFSYQPLISIVMPVYNVEIGWLKLAIDSVLAQFYENWELCIVDDASTKKDIRPFLEKYAQKDRRIKIKFLKKNLHISGSSNEALKMAAGEFIALLDNDDELTPDALFETVKALNENNKIDVMYSDEDKIDDKQGFFSEPTYKPEWSLNRMLHFMYTGHLAIYRKKIIDKIGGFRVGYEGAQDYDLMLRFVEQTENIHHIEKILYHWRKVPTSVAVNPDSKSYAYEAGKITLEDYLRRNGIKGRVEMPTRGSYEIIRG